MTMAIGTCNKAPWPTDIPVQLVQQRVLDTTTSLFNTTVGVCVAMPTAPKRSTSGLPIPIVEVLVPEKLKDAVVVDGEMQSTSPMLVLEQALLVLKALRVLLAPLALPVHRERQARRVLLEQQVHRERKDLQGFRAHKESAVRQDHKALLVLQVHRDSGVQQEHQARLDNKGPRAPPVREVSPAYRVSQDLRVMPDHAARQVHKAHRVPQVLKASEVSKVSAVCLVRLDPKVFKVTQVHRAHPEQWVLQDLKDQLAHLDHRAQLVLMELTALLLPLSIRRWKSA